jgi:putative transposase
MSQYRRVYVAHSSYFFTLVTWRRRPLLADPVTVTLFRDCLRRVRQRLPFQLTAITLLPDHLHCIWHLSADCDYSRRWQAIKALFTRKMKAGPVGPPYWQPRFWEHLIRDEEDWRRHLDYIHYNPVRHGLVECPGDWPHSSFDHFRRRGFYPEAWGQSGEPGNIKGLVLE